MCLLSVLLAKFEPLVLSGVFMLHYVEGMQCNSKHMSRLSGLRRFLGVPQVHMNGLQSQLVV